MFCMILTVNSDISRDYVLCEVPTETMILVFKVWIKWDVLRKLLKRILRGGLNGSSSQFCPMVVFYSVAVICYWLELVVTAIAKHWSPQELWNAEFTAFVDLTVSSHSVQAPAIGHKHESVCAVMSYCPKIPLYLFCLCLGFPNDIFLCDSLYGILHPFNVFQCVLYTNTLTPQGNKTIKQKILNRTLLKQEVNLKVKKLKFPGSRYEGV